MSEKMAKMQRDFALRLYRSILVSHRALPQEMRVIGNLYVREEFKLHKNAKPEHLQPFFDQWLQYLEHMKELTQGKKDAFDIGTNLEYEEIDSLPEEKKEKLFKMHDETARLFSGNYTAADMGVDAMPEDVATADADALIQEAKATVSTIPTVSVKAKTQ